MLTVKHGDCSSEQQIRKLSSSLPLEPEPDIKNGWISGKPEPNIWCISSILKHISIRSWNFAFHLVWYWSLDVCQKEDHWLNWHGTTLLVKFSASRGYLSIMHSSSVISKNIEINHIIYCQKQDSLGYISVLESMSINSNHFDIIGPQSCQIWQNNAK